jgi:hypothetical protein
MEDTAFNHVWQLVGGAIALNPDTFRLFQTLPQQEWVALLITLAAGFSNAVGQGIILFVNRVRPFRFILSLFLSAVLFVVGWVFWAISTRLAYDIAFEPNSNWGQIGSILGLAYAPQLLSFLIAAPYLGVPISILLSIWSFLSFLTGMEAVLSLSAWQAFLCSGLGWAMLQVLQRTIGRPLKKAGQWLQNTAAGTQLVTDLRGVERIIQTGILPRRGDRQD